MVGASPSGSVVDSINNLDDGNPLHVQNSDNSSSVIIRFKLLGTEIYRIWSGAMKLALQARNKYCFVDGSCLKESYATSDVLSAQWDRCNAMVLTWIMNVVSQDIYMGSREFDALTKLPKSSYDVKCSCDAGKELGLHQQLMKLMQFLMGLDDYYQPVRSSLLTRDPLHEVKDAYNVISREESHRGVPESSGVTESKGTSSNVNKGPNPNLNCKHCGKIGHTIDRCFEIVGFLQGFKRNFNSNSNTGKQFFNANFDVKMSDKPSSSSLSYGFTFEQIQKLLNLINDKSSRSIHANMSGRASFFNGNVWFNINFSRYFFSNSSLSMTAITLGWIIDSRANQHLTGSTSRMINVVDISDLKINVGHPNGTLAVISHVGNLKLTNNVMLYDVLVVPGYCVSLLSVNKLIRDTKMFVSFNENKCYIQDLKREKILGIGSESGGLYLFDVNKSNCIGQSNMVMNFHVSKLLWQNRLGHPADQVLSVLKKDLNIYDNTYVPMCEICQRAKQTREPFPLSDNKSKTLGELVHLDLWGPYRVHSREGYRYFLTIVDDYFMAVWVYLVKTKDELPHSPYDDGRDSFNVNGSLPHTDSHDSTQDRNQGDRHTTTQIKDQNRSEGNTQNNNQSSPIQVNDDVQTLMLRRSNRQSKLPVRLNDYILSSNVKYGIEKYVNYTKLSRVNMCFGTSLNKSVKPTCLSKALSDPDWVKAMNNKIEALNRNNTWTICDIERYKARLVAKGYSQREGFDYDETFSSVVKMVTVRCLRALVVVNNWPLFQLDVNNAFLYGDLLEDVYMTLPKGQWNAKLTTALAEHGFKQSKLDYSLYTKYNGEKFISLLVYVDDTVITGNDNIRINDFKVKYCLELLHEYGLLAARPVDIPLPENYILSQHMHSPLQSHFKAALRVLRYLKGSPSCGVQFYKNSDLKLKAYADADWAKCPKTRRSMSTTSSEVVWLGNLLHNLGLRNLYHVELFCDNSSAIQIDVNPVFHERTKHFELDVHFVREKVLAGMIKTVKISTDLQTAYVFTNCLGVMQHKLCCKNLDMLDVFADEMVGKDSGRKGHAVKKKKKSSSLSA
ncbi:ribonuclease H-like domain-containing protein [Tanacetum coccineum]